MDFRSLYYFVTVAKELNITRAAAVLKMSQPPLSNRIKQLEEDLGTTLFIRRKRGLQLTSTGKILYKRARQVLELADHTREEITNYEKELSGHLMIGGVEGRAPFLIARWIAGFREEFPLVTYTIRSGGSDDILEQLQRHLIDIAVIAAPYNPEMLNGFSVGRQPWVAMIPRGHPLAMKEGNEILLSDLKDQPLIVPERRSRVEAIERWFAEEKLNPRMVCRCSNYINALALVEQNVGICIFPQSSYVPGDYMTTKMIADSPKYAEYMLVYTKDHPLSELAESFRDYVKDSLEEEKDEISGPKGRKDEFSLPADATFL